MEQVIEYIPLIIAFVIVAVVTVLYQNNIFVKPEQLERKHNEIMKEMDEKLKSKADQKQIEYIHCELTEMRGKIDKIYDHLLNNKE